MLETIFININPRPLTGNKNYLNKHGYNIVREKVTLFNYDNCFCKNENCKSVVALANILPVNVCNLIGGYIKPTCFDCSDLMEAEEHFVRDKQIPEEGLEKAELQLQVIKLMQNTDITQLAENGYSIKIRHYRKHIDRVFDIHEVKEWFRYTTMHYQALKSYCKNNQDEVTLLLKHCLKIEELKFIINSDLFFPNLNSWWSYINTSYYIRNILSDLIEIYTDQLIKDTRIIVVGIV